MINYYMNINKQILLNTLIFYFVSILFFKYNILNEPNCLSYKNIIIACLLFTLKIYLVQYFLKKEHFQSNNNLVKIKYIINEHKHIRNKIPQLIIQTYYTNSINIKVANNIKYILNNNPQFEYRLITDNMGIELIKKHFNNNVLEAFLKLNVGAAKGDFIRYIALYVYGGVYLDLDSSITIDLNTFINYDLDFIFFYDHAYNLMNTPIITKKNNPIILKLIYEVVKRINNKEQNIFLATGPTVFTDVVYNDITNNNIYNVSQSTETKKRKEVFMNNKFYKNGLLLYKKPFFKFRMDDYSDNLLYSEQNKYIVTYNAPTPNLYK